MGHQGGHRWERRSLRAKQCQLVDDVEGEEEEDRGKVVEEAEHDEVRDERTSVEKPNGVAAEGEAAMNGVGLEPVAEEEEEAANETEQELVAEAAKEAAEGAAAAAAATEEAEEEEEEEEEAEQGASGASCRAAARGQ